MLRLVHIVLVCWLGLVLSGLPRLVAADACARSCLEHHQAEEEDCADTEASGEGDAECCACLCSRVPWVALPSPAVPPEVAAPLLSDGSKASGGVPLNGSSREVFQPPRTA